VSTESCTFKCIAEVIKCAMNTTVDAKSIPLGKGYSGDNRKKLKFFSNIYFKIIATCPKRIR